jgi:peptidoglycan/LPS O-acetylase OafA/YrhL
LPEALFYVGVPLFFWRINWYYLLSALIYVGSFLTYPDAAATNVLVHYFVVYNFYFALGVALYDIVLHTNWLGLMRRSSGKFLALLSILLFGMMLGAKFTNIMPLSGLFAALLAFLSISALLAGKVSPRNWLIRSARYIGIRSFSLYLYHFPLLILCYTCLVWLTGELVFYQRYYWLGVLVVTLLSVGLYQVTERLSVDFFRKV